MVQMVGGLIGGSMAGQWVDQMAGRWRVNGRSVGGSICGLPIVPLCLVVFLVNSMFCSFTILS